MVRTYRSPAERRRVRRRWLVPAGVAAVLALVLIALDPVMHGLFVWGNGTAAAKESLEGADWYQVLRQWGHLLNWVFVAAAVMLLDIAWLRGRGIDPTRPAKRGDRTGGPEGTHRAGLVILSAAGAGLIAEAFKFALGRSRPDDSGRAPFFSWDLAEVWGLGGPSSHAAVAFGGMVMLALLFPPVRTVAVVIAVGCGWSRLAVGAHSFTDVLAGAAIGMFIAIGLHRLGENVRRTKSLVPMDGRLG